jgi:excinuclease UvrABC nuclease subunit
MPIDTPWRKLIREQVHNAPDYAGVYECADILQDLVFIGKTNSLAQTMELMLDRKDPDFNVVNFFRFQTAQDPVPVYNKLIEDYQQKFNRLPPINQKKEPK